MGVGTGTFIIAQYMTPMVPRPPPEYFLDIVKYDVKNDQFKKYSIRKQGICNSSQLHRDQFSAHFKIPMPRKFQRRDISILHHYSTRIIQTMEE